MHAMKMNGETTLSTIPKPLNALRPGRKTGSAQVDWEAIRQKALESSARQAWMDDAPQEVLEQAWALRASRLAQVIEDGEIGEQIQVAVIRLGREIYGLEVDYVVDIRPLESITRVPRVPDWMVGVVNLRGRIISVLDLQRFLGLPPTEKEGPAESTTHHLVVVATPVIELAMLVDEVLAIEALPVSQIQEAASAVRGIQTEYMRGIVSRTQAGGHQETNGKNENGEARSFSGTQNQVGALTGVDTALLLLLDLPALLADKRLIVHEDII
jgi:purine-binding chemotaxis protein CheW